MARFQGIPVEEEVQVSPRFQGVPVDAEPQEPKEQDSWPEVIGKSVMQGALAVPKIISEGGHVIRKIAGMPESEFRQKVTEAEKYWQPETEGSKAKELVGQAARTVGEMGSTAAVGGAPAILPLLAGRAGAEKSAKSLDEGYSVPKSLVAGAGQAAIEYFTEKIPLGILQKPGLSFIKRLGMGLVTDVPGELAATAGEMALIDTKVLGKEYNPEQYKQALIDTAIVSGLVTGGATSISHPLVQKPKGPLARAAERVVVQQPVAQEVIQANQEAPQIYRDQPQEKVTPQPAYTDAEAQAMERAAKIRNTMAITPESQAPSPIETERTLAPARVQEYAPEAPQGAAWNEELQRQGEQAKAETEKFKPTAEPLTASTDTLIDTFDEIPVNQTPRTITRKAEGGFYGGAPTLPQVIRQKTYTTEKVAKNALKLLKNKINVDEYDVFPATGGWQIRTRDDAAKQKAMAEYNNNLPEDIRDAVIKMESDISQGEVGGNAYNDKSGTTQRYKSTNPDYIQLKTLQVYDKKHGTSLAKIVNKDSIAKVISAFRSGKELTGNNRQVWDYVKEQAANLNKTDTELVSGQEADRITKEGIDIGQKRTVVVGDLSEGDKVVVENKGIPDVVEHKGFDEEGNIILEDGKRFTVDQFDKIDIYGEKKAPTTPALSFTTEKGSVYSWDGKTTERVKAKRPEHGEDFGKKERSEVTFFLSPEDAREIGMWNTMSGGGKRIVIRGDELILTSPNPKTGARGSDGRFKFTTSPEVGRSPLELWKADENGFYRSNHPGNKITNIEAPTTPATDRTIAKGQQIKSGGTDLTYQGQDAMGLHNFRIESEGPEKLANISTKTLGAEDIGKTVEAAKQRFAPKPDRIAKTLGKDDMINGITRDEAGDMLADGDEAILSHIREGMEKHGKMAMEDAIRNQEITEVAGVPKEKRGEIKERIAKLKPQIDEILNGKAAPDVKAPTSAGEDTGAASPEKARPADGKETPPSLTKEQGKESDVKYSRATKSTNTAEQVLEELTTGEYAKAVTRMIKNGSFEVVQSPSDVMQSPDDMAVPVGEFSADGAGGYYGGEVDKIFLVADNIPQGNEVIVLLHEAFHRSKAKGKIQPILDELGRLEKMAGKKGAVSEWFTKARESAQVDKGTPQYLEEIGAYSLQNYEASPNIIKAWVDKLIAKVRAAIFQTFGVMPKKLDPAFLREIALSGLRGNVEKGGSGTVFSRMAKDFSITVAEAKKQYDDVVAKFKGTDGWMKAPNGEPTKLNERQWVQVQTTAFKEWFGESKVVDDNGDPLVVYHGTRQNFKSFLPTDKTRNYSHIAKGSFFTDNQEDAAWYTEKEDYDYNKRKGENPQILPVFIKLEKPLMVNAGKEDATNHIDRVYDQVTDKAKQQRKEGIIITGRGPSIYVVYKPNSIKSAIGNTGQFSKATDDIRYSRVAPKDFNEANKAVDEMMQEDNELWDMPDKATKSDTFLWYIQDKLQPLAKVQSKLGKIPDSINALQKARLQVAKSKADIDDFENEHVKPLTDDMKKSGLSLEEVDSYLYAKHVHLDKVNDRLRQINAKRYLEDLADIKKGLAGKIEDLEVKYDFDSPERKRKYVELLESSFDVNDEAQAKLKARWDRFSEKPSGMTDAEAKSIYESKKSDDLERISGRVSSINDFRVKTLLKAGIISDEEAKAWKGAYKHFVPLKREGFDEQRLPVGRGISDLAKGSKARAGSTRRAVNILANTIASAEQSIVREKKSETMKALVGLIRANPNPDFWSVEKSKKTPGYDTYGNIRMYTTQEDGAEIIPVRLDGERFVIRFGKTNDAGLRIAAALKNDLHNQGPIVNALSVATRALAMVNTSLSPEFVISNFLRDIQTSFYNISDTDVAKLKKKIITDVRKSMPGIWRSLGGNHDTEWAKWTDDYRKNGGMISWLSDYASVEKTAKKLESEVAAATDAKYMAREKFLQLGNLVSRINNTIENAVRVSFYKNAVESGIMTMEQAALAAKELTTNFETKGAAGQVINSLYMFANAGIQGSTRIIKAIKSSRKVQGLVGMTIFAGMIMDMFNRSAGGDDDDKMPFYDKIPKYIKERNIIIMLDKGKYIKIPMPWGYNVFFNIGNELGRSMTEKGYDPVESAGRVLYSAINAFNPLQAATIAQTIAPTVADPFVQIWENKSWAGTPMKPENSPFDKTPKPEYQMYWKSAGSLSKAIAKELNDLTGGNEIKPGAINISPAWIDNMYNNVTGALGKFVSDSLGTSYKVLTGEEVETKEKPFIRKVFGEKSDYEDRSLYYERVKEIILDREQYKEKPEMRKEIVAKYKNFPKLVLIADASEKRLLKLNKLKKKSSSDKQNELIDKYMEKVYDNFNRNYNKSTR